MCTFVTSLRGFWKLEKAKVDTIPENHKKLLDEVGRYFENNWPVRIRKCMVGALLVYNYRLSDMTVREQVHVLYACIHEHLKAHNGRLWPYDKQRGYFRRFDAILPGEMLDTKKFYLLECEGCFRSMKGDV